MARILLTEHNPAMQALLESFGHELEIFSARASIEEQLLGVDVVLPGLDPFGRPFWPYVGATQPQRD